MRQGARERLCILGATGSIGRQTLDVVGRFQDRFEIVSLAAASNWHALAELADTFGVRTLALAEQWAADALRQARPDLDCRGGREALVQLVEQTEPDTVVVAVAGLAALRPMLAALRLGAKVAFASKEPIVAAGRIVTETARRHAAALVPIDSEISAVFQCMQGVKREWVEKILLTASGGPFAEASMEELEKVTPQQALAHPTWRMGPKVTVDSATLMNKGFEVFEMHWLFGVPYDDVDVIVHHQSIIHSAIQLIDGSVIAQLSVPDMRLPIQYALFYPERAPSNVERLDLVSVGKLTFAAPDLARFPCLRLAYEAARAGGTYPAVLSAADEVAVRAFLDRKIKFTDIPRVLEATLEAHTAASDDALEHIIDADAWAREYCTRLIEQSGSGVE